MRALWAIALLAICFAAQSQEPSPSPAKPSQPRQHQTGSGQQQAPRNQSVTIKAPVEIKLLNTGKTSEEAKQEAEERKEKSSSDRWMVILTGVLGFLAFLQLLAFIVQAIYLGKTVAGAEAAAEDARDTSRRELRPYVGPEKLFFIAEEFNGITLPPPLVSNFVLKTSGKRRPIP